MGQCLSALVCSQLDWWCKRVTLPAKWRRPKIELVLPRLLYVGSERCFEARRRRIYTRERDAGCMCLANYIRSKVCALHSNSLSSPLPSHMSSRTACLYLYRGRCTQTSLAVHARRLDPEMALPSHHREFSTMDADEKQTLLMRLRCVDATRAHCSPPTSPFFNSDSAP
jgi:hypothetical protein